MSSTLLEGGCQVPAGWSVMRFADVLDGGVRNGIYKPKQFHGRGVKIVNMGELFAHSRLGHIEMKRVELSDAEILKSSLLRGDLLFARRSLVAEGAGKCSIVCEIAEPTTFESSIIRARPNARLVDPWFLYYFFSSPNGRHALGTILRHVAVAGITGSDLIQLRIPLPPLQEQKSISALLGALDEKIELNRRMNETMEEMARSLFKSWFVDFDPVRAKIDGNVSWTDSETAALFSDALVETELGPLPAHWRCVPFGDFFAIPLRNGLTKPKRVRGAGTLMVNMGELFAHRRIGDIPMDRVQLTEHEELTSMVEAGDLLFARQSLVRSGAGQCSLVAEAVERRTFESHLIRCRLDRNKAEPLVYFYYFWSRPGRSRIESIVEQVAAAGIRGSDLSRLSVPVAPLSIQARFASLIHPMEITMQHNQNQSRSLENLRDLLLPKLLSGELRVRDAERVVEAVA